MRAVLWPAGTAESILNSWPEVSRKSASKSPNPITRKRLYAVSGRADIPRMECKAQLSSLPPYLLT
eukprot:4557239-Pyramimonas_sp.AAC.1